MPFRFSNASIEKLKSVHPDLIRVMQRTIEISPVDFKITHGLRTQAEQDALYAQGRTTPGKIVTNTRKSRHIGGFAVDVAAIVNGAISWDMKYYRQITDAAKQASRELNIPIKCGIDWKMKDGPHIELNRDFYPDKVNA